MDKHYPDQVDEYNEVKHAAIYRIQNTVAPGLSKKVEELNEIPKDDQISGARPTSGKHYARMHSGIKRKRIEGKPPQDPLQSDLAKTYEKTQKVETLMNRLAEYMAGDIPDDNIGDLIKDEDEGEDESPDHSKSVQNIPLASLEPAEVFRSPSQLDHEPMQIEAPIVDIDYGDDTGDEGDGDDGKNLGNFLPEIKITSKTSPDKSKKKKIPKKAPEPKDDPMFIYKDFDTSLTKVGGNMNVHPAMVKTTSVRGEDLIRDRLLTFKYRNGSVQTQIGNDKQRDKTSPPKRKVIEYAQMKTKTRLSSNMVHKAFFVHNVDKYASDVNTPLK